MLKNGIFASLLLLGNHALAEDNKVANNTDYTQEIQHALDDFANVWNTHNVKMIIKNN